MIVAVGMHSAKVYAKGEDKAEVCRYLDKHYKYKSHNNMTMGSISRIYSEPLKFERR